MPVGSGERGGASRIGGLLEPAASANLRGPPVAGGNSEAARQWDAHAENEIGAMIDRYITANPPPDGATCSEPFGRWAGQLRRSGQARLAALGEPRLRAL